MNPNVIRTLFVLFLIVVLSGCATHYHGDVYAVPCVPAAPVGMIDWNSPMPINYAPPQLPWPYGTAYANNFYWR